MTKEETIKGIRSAAKQREQAMQKRRTATAALQGWIAEARDAGVSISEIAREGGLSRQGVYDLMRASSLD